MAELTETVRKQVAEVLEAELIQLLVTERLQRLEAIRLRWDWIHEALNCRHSPGMPLIYAQSR